MHRAFTLKNTCQKKGSAWLAKVFILSLLLLSQAVTLFAHTVDYFNSCGYICTGSTLSVTAHVSNTNNSSKYNWQYRDNSNNWKCFVNGNNTINGVVSSVSGVSATGTLSTSPALSITNAQSNLEDVEVRLLIADGSTPCASNPSYTIYGGDKSLRLHVLSGSDCNTISTYCSMGGCVGNTLSNSDGFYGGFEINTTSLGSAGSDYTITSSTSSCGQYSLVNNTAPIYSGFGSFAPHSGNLMMFVDGSGASGKRVWYNTVSVVKGSTYQFSMWIANVSNTNSLNAIAHLKITGANSAEATKTVTATAGDWQYVKVDYTASQSGSVTLSVTDDNTSCTGNDFVIDDICFVCHGPAPTLTLGNQVWNDYDGDGKRDDNEPGIPGATISLYTDNNSDNLPDGAAIKTTTTDALGHYQFTNLTEGRYIVSMPILPGYQQSPNNSTQATSPYPDNNTDNDDNLVRLVGPNGPGGIVYTNAITLTAGQEPTTDGDDANGNNTLDLAECGNSFIGDFVWNDLNGNGIQDAGEPGINGVPVTITFSDGRTATTTTLTYNAANNSNAPQFDGYYNFPNLGPGTYKISFATPAGLHASPANAGGNDAKDSDPVNGGPVTVTIAANQSDFTIDAGFTNYVPATNLTLGNQVWNDYDGDGKRDDNEPGIPGATISLYTDNDGDNLPDGAAIKTTVSDALGHYQFTNLTEGRYIVSMPILPGYQQSPNNSTQATSPYPDNDIDNDDNLVRLVGPNGPGGIVYTNAITLIAGQEPTTDGDDANGNNTLDLAECGNSFIGDFVWNDLNGNGIQDAGEPGINGVPVTITFSDGRTATTTTLTYNAANNSNAPQFDGYYNFPNLGPGTYKISFATPAGLHASPANAGGNDAKDSDPVNGGPVTVTIAANQSDFTIDAGFTAFVAPPPPPTCPNLSVGNMVFNDANDNGVKDATEQGIGGLTVKLYADSDGNNVADGAAVSTIMTAADGTYYFGNLSAGKYIVGVTLTDSLLQGAKADATPDDNKDNDNNGVKTTNGEVLSNYITLSAGDEPIYDGSDNNSNLTLDFGLQLKADTCTNHCQCHNDCNHTGCGHANCGHNSCKNDCNHTGCGHANCGHASTNGDCAGTTSTKGYFGGFEAGSDNFSTSTGKTDLRYGLPRNGSFETIKKSSDCGGSSYLKLSPHSGSYFMVAHTSSDATDNIWSATVNVVPGKTYTFTIWMANAKTDPVNGFAITLNAGDKVLTKGYADYNWGKLSATYTIPQGVTSIEFSIKDPYPELTASHYVALDDICISTDNSSSSSSSVSTSKIVSPVYPNPAATNFTLNVTAAKTGTAIVSLISMSGKTIFTENRSVSSGSNAIAIDRIKDITGGTYNVQVIIDNQVYNQIMVISR